MIRSANLQFLCRLEYRVFRIVILHVYRIHHREHAWFFRFFLKLLNMAFEFFKVAGALELGCKKYVLKIEIPSLYSLFHSFPISHVSYEPESMSCNCAWFLPVSSQSGTTVHIRFVCGGYSRDWSATPTPTAKSVAWFFSATWILSMVEIICSSVWCCHRSVQERRDRSWFSWRRKLDRI